ncbi:MAG: hypothetical protein ABIQ12_15595, partial [Opitutaceae bacterium]
DPIVVEILQRFPGQELATSEARDFWRGVTEFQWAHAAGALAKVALTPALVPAFNAWVRTRAEARGWVSAGGNVGYVSVAADVASAESPWPGVSLRGAGPLWVGPRRDYAVMRAVKAALDPQNRFPTLDD